MSMLGLESPGTRRDPWMAPITYRATPVVGTIVHTGGTAAQNDMSVSGNFRDVSDVAEFTVQIATEGVPDTISWSYKINGVTIASESSRSIVTGAMYLAAGMFVTFATTTGHAAGEQWQFICASQEWRDHSCSVSNNAETLIDGYAHTIQGHLRHEGMIYDQDGRALLNDLYSNAPCYRFDGVNDLVNVPDDADLDMVLDDFSMQVVFRPDDVTVATQWLMNKESGGVGYGLRLERGNLVLRIDDNTTDSTGVVAYDAAKAGQVCNAVVTVDRDGNATAYINGKAVASDVLAQATALTLTNAGALRIGTNTAGGASTWFKGDIYTVRVWNRLLSASEARGFSKGAAVPWSDMPASASITTTEHLQDGTAFAGSWTKTGAFTADAGGLKYLAPGAATHSALQTAVNRTVAGTGGKRYRFSYDVATIDVTPTATLTATLTIAFGLTAVTLDIATTGRKVYDFVAAEGAATGDFKFQIVSSAGVGTIHFDNFSLIEIGCVAEFDGDGVDSTTWYDGTLNADNGTITSAVAHNLLTHLTIGGSVHLTGSLIVDGDLTVSGDTVTTNVATVSVEDPLIFLANGNPADALDVGFYAKYVSAGTKYTGLFRDASDGIYKLFKGTGTEPTTTVNIAAGGYDHADLQLGGLTVDDALSVGTNVSFLKDVNHTISIATSTAETLGGDLTVTAGAGGAAGAGAGAVGGGISVFGATGGAGSAGQLAGNGGVAIVAGGNAGTNGGAGGANGGNLSLRGGNASGAGTDGAVLIGDANTASVTVTPAADFDGGITMAASTAITGDGHTQIGVAAGAFDLSLKMGDAGGVQKTNFKDSAGAVVASVNSDGLGTFATVSIGSAGGRPVKDLGRLAVGWIRFDANANALDTVVIGTETWTENGTNDAFKFDQSGGLAACMTSLTQNINDDSLFVRAVEVGGDMIALFAKVAGVAGNLGITVDGVRLVASAATMLGGLAAAERVQCSGTYTVTETDRLGWLDAAANELAIAAIPSTATPILMSFYGRDSSWVCKSMNTVMAKLVQQGANEWALVVSDPAAVLSTNDVLSFIIEVAA